MSLTNEQLKRNRIVRIIVMTCNVLQESLPNMGSLDIDELQQLRDCNISKVKLKKEYDYIADLLKWNPSDNVEELLFFDSTLSLKVLQKQLNDFKTLHHQYFQEVEKDNTLKFIIDYMRKLTNSILIDRQFNSEFEKECHITYMIYNMINNQLKTETDKEMIKSMRKYQFKRISKIAMISCYQKFIDIVSYINKLLTLFPINDISRLVLPISQINSFDDVSCEDIKHQSKTIKLHIVEFITTYQDHFSSLYSRTNQLKTGAGNLRKMIHTISSIDPSLSSILLSANK